ncbi:hypothetical protein BDF14DRAFT_1752766 [Spinellus fusiger]|nr:hypothetical protein BDF14DRAFT_1752766 [Spinellus fusiger]
MSWSVSISFFFSVFLSFCLSFSFSFFPVVCSIHGGRRELLFSFMALGHLLTGFQLSCYREFLRTKDP